MDSQYVDDGPEWVSCVGEDGTVKDGARCGMPQDLDLFSEKWGTGTIISTRGASYAMRRVAMINFHSSMNHRDRALFHAYKDIDSAAITNLSLPTSVVRDAKVMWRKFTGDKLTRGAVRKGIKANCVLYACKLNKVSRTTKEIADAFNVPTRDISRTAQLFKETIIPTKATEGPKITTPHDVIHRLLNAFDIPDKRPVRMKCLRMADTVQSCIPLMGKTPTSIATVIIYKVLGNQYSKSEVCEKCNVSAPTVNKIETIINKYLESKPTC
tara:strand:+ start:4158 stop:4964 length:807 start_codon:yes stop_codon:yes gene_type:complete